MNDYTFTYKNPALQFMLDSQNSELKKNLISIQVDQKERQHPEYENLDIDIKVEFGKININIKPGVIQRILDFFKTQGKNEEDLEDVLKLMYN